MGAPGEFMPGEVEVGPSLGIDAGGGTPPGKNSAR